jgi:hypothetical protein
VLGGGTMFVLVDMERFDCSEGEEGKHFGS